MIHCIGDSHVYVFSGVDSIGAKDIHPYFKTYRLGPHTAYNVMKRKDLIEQIIRNEVKPGDSIMFCFGEIDCRVHLLKQAEQQQNTIAAMVNGCVERYFEIFSLASKYGSPLLAWNVPASSREEVDFGEYSTYGSCKQRNDVSRLFNECLRNKCKDGGVAFISIFDTLLDKDGLTNPFYYMDTIHLSQKVMPLILKALQAKGIDAAGNANHKKQPVSREESSGFEGHQDTNISPKKKVLIYCGINNLLNFSKLRPQFDVCYGFDANPKKIEQAKQSYKNDPQVHIVFGALTDRSGEEIEFNITNDWDPSSTLGKFNPEYIHMRSGKLAAQTKIKVPTINLYDFCINNNIQEIDTLITDLQGMDLSVLKTLKQLITSRKIREIQCETETDDTPPIHLNLPTNKFTDLKQLLSEDYKLVRQEPEIVPADWWEMDTLWQVKNNIPTVQKPLLINLVYEHLQNNQIHSVYRENVFVLWSSLPLEGFDIYAYLNSNSFRGKQPGLDVLLMLEPVVVLPGEYNEEIWRHFDHVFTLCDSLVGRDRKFKKIQFPRSDWIIPAAVTEDLELRRKMYPQENRAHAICMINGNKQSFVTSELYSKRVEAAQWFNQNSDIPCDIFGNPPFLLPNYRGAVASDAKLTTLSKYRYCLCFENTNHPVLSAGYITEKILDCFETRTIPIYFGSVNIDKYIPPACFIDLRNFKSYQALNEYLHSLGPEQYTRFIDAIDTWVAHGGLRPYSWFALYDQLAPLPNSESSTRPAVAGPPENAAWTPGVQPFLKDRTWAPVTASPPLWSWSSLAHGTSSLLEGTGSSLPFAADSHPLDKRGDNTRRLILEFGSTKMDSGSLRPEFLRDLALHFDLDVFVETGTYLGDTSIKASHLFNAVHTIELSSNLYQHALNRFKRYTNINIYNGDSAQVFPQILCNIKQKILFWLDGHYSEGPTAKGDKNTPILQELSAIKNAGIHNAVILIDDLRMFEAVWVHIPDEAAVSGYPRVVDLCNAIREIDESYQFAVLGDVFMAYPPTEAFSVTPVVASCTLSRLYSGSTVDLDAVLEAEQVIAHAIGDQLRAVNALCETFRSSEAFGFCRHYRLWYALTLMVQKNFSRACTELQIAISLGLDHWRSSWYLAKAAYEAGRYSLSERSLSTVLLAAPGFDEALLLKKQLDQVRTAGKSEDKISVEDLSELLNHFHLARKTDAALSEIASFFSDGTQNADISYRHARILLEAGRQNDALREYQRVIQISPRHSNAHSDLGVLYSVQGINDKALEHLRTAILLNEKNYPAIQLFLDILVGMQKYEDVTCTLKELLEKTPEDGELLAIAQQIVNDMQKVVGSNTADAASEPSMLNTEGDLKRTAADYYRILTSAYQTYSDQTDTFVHQVWKNQLATLGSLILGGLPDNFLLHPICLEMFVRVGWQAPQEYELAYIEKLGNKLKKKILSLKESPIGGIPRDCKKHPLSVNTLGMLWYYARIYEYLSKSPKTIVEFGGGFGSLARVFKTLSSKDLTYCIIDLPEMLSLQFYYLFGTLGREFVAAHTRSDEPLIPGKINLYPVYGIETLDLTADLFVSTFALSETPALMQDLVCRSKDFFHAPLLYITGQYVTERKELGWQPPHTIVQSAQASRSAVTVNRFHMGDNYELVAAPHKIVGESDGRPSQHLADTTKLLHGIRTESNKSTSDGQEGSKIVVLIFSKDRAMQLHANLQSFFLHCSDKNQIDPKVLYTTSSPIHEGQYRNLIQEYNFVDFIKETSFKNDVLAALSTYEYVLFLVDDNIFVRDFAVADAIESLRKHPDTIGFSLRLGNNTTYCYMLDKPQVVPWFQAAGNSVVLYDWTTAELDFNYPLEVSSSLYRLADLLPLMNHADFRNPNTLELMLDSNKAEYKENRHKLICYEQSVAFCNPLNMVQTMWVNRAGNKSLFTPEKLSHMFEQGLRIDVGSFSDFVPNACHQEVEFQFVDQSGKRIPAEITVPLVSIMIISYNGIDHIKACIESIKRNTPESHEIVVVDNARDDGSLEYIKTVPGTVVVSNPTNIGYSPARAQAMSLVKGKYIVSLDDDTVVTKGWVSKFIKHADSHPEIGIIGPRSNYVSGPQIVKNVSYKNNDELEVFSKTWSDQNRDHLTPTFRLVGFCMFIVRKVIDTIGCIDPNFGKLFGFDDDDYSYRAQIAGFKLAIADNIFIHHTGGPQGEGNKQYNELMMGAWEMFKKKWKIQQDLPYGDPYNLTELLSRPFDKAVYYSPLYDRSLLAPLVYTTATLPEGVRTMATTKGLTSIIIWSAKQTDHIKECLKSILKYTPEQHEVIVLDNGEVQKNSNWLRSIENNNKNVTIVEERGAAGFISRINRAILEASGEFVLLLEGDIVVTDGWLTGLLECVNSDDMIGVVGPMTNNATGLQKIEPDVYKSLEQLPQFAASFRNRNRFRKIVSNNIAGFCMLLRRSAFDNIGVLDENFDRNMYVFDDLCRRLLLEGYKNIIAGDVFVHGFVDFATAFSKNKDIYDEKWHILDAGSDLSLRLKILQSMEKANLSIQKGQIDDAIKTLIERIGYSPNERQFYYFLFEILIDDKRFQDTLDAIKEMPDTKNDARYFEIIGYCQEGLGNYNEANKHADKALSIKDNFAPALNLKGILEYRRGDRNKAEAFFNRAIDAAPGYGEPYTNLGMLRWVAGRKEEALDLFERGCVLSPDKNDIIVAYHNAITACEAFSRAESVFMEARTVYPQNKRLLFLLIGVLLKQNKYLEAMREAEEAIILSGADDDLLAAAAAIRDKIGPKEIGKKSAGKPVLSLCMIVKNEEEYLAKCLYSIVPIVDEMILVDTGSTDRTKAIAMVFGAKIFDFTWTNSFAEARNFSLSKASGDWILLFDADEIISPLDHQKLKNLLKNSNRKAIAYHITTRNYLSQVGIEGWVANDGKFGSAEAGCGWMPSSKIRLFPNDKRIQFENPVHEFVENSVAKAGIEIKTCDIPIHHYGRLNIQKTTNKFENYFLLGMKKLEETGDDPRALSELAIQAAELKRHEEAIGLWERVLKITPRDPKAYYNMGSNYLGLGRYQDGLTATKEAVKISPDLKEAVSNYGLCEVLIGDNKTAIEVLESLINKVEYPIGMGLLALAYIMEGNREKGLRYINKLRKKNYDCSAVFLEVGQRLNSVGRTKNAAIILDAAVENNIANQDIVSLRNECKKIIASQERPVLK